MKVLIFDLTYANYNGRATPKPSMFAMLASGWHKSQGDTVIFTSDIPTNFAAYDLVYINKDSFGLFHLKEWLYYPNVRLIGAFWGDEPAYYNVEWELAPPDITLYHDWIHAFMKKFPGKNVKLFEVFFDYTPVKWVQKNKITNPQGSKILIIDRDWTDWDKDFVAASELNIKKLRFLYPIEINDNCEKLCQLIYHNKNIERTFLWLGLHGIIPKEKQIEYARIFKKYKLGRNVKIKWTLHTDDPSEWAELLLKAVDMFETFLTEGKKYLFADIPDKLFIEDPQMKLMYSAFSSWSNMRLVNTRNNLIDYLIYNSINDYNNIIEFLKHPDEFVRGKKRKGQAAMTIFLGMFEDEEKTNLVYELSKVQRAPLNVVTVPGDIRENHSDTIDPRFLPFIHNLFSNDNYAKKLIAKELTKE